MTSKLNILITGATGYIGGSVLTRLLSHPDFSTFHIVAVVRSSDKAAKLRELGVDAVVGSHSDPAFISPLAEESDVVIAVANADDFEAVKAILHGLKLRKEKTGVQPILIHTSGTGVLTDDAAGDKITTVVYDDANPDQIESLPDTQLHRNVDLEILKADKEGFIKSYIVLPGTIYGLASGVLVDKGIQNPHSLQAPQLIRAALKRGRAGMVGEGRNFWPNVSIDDVADLYIVLFNAIRKAPDSIGHGREGFYFGVNGEHTLYEVGKAIGEALVALGKASSSEPTTFTKEEIDEYLEGSTYLGTNSRCVANSSKSIGWAPKKGNTDFFASLLPETKALMKSV